MHLHYKDQQVEEITVYSKDHTKPRNILFTQNAGLYLTVIAVGTLSYHSEFKGLMSGHDQALWTLRPPMSTASCETPMGWDSNNFVIDWM
jgi:hypothetical protein